MNTILPFNHYLETGTPFAPDSFLDQGEWFKFKNIDDFFQDGGFFQESFKEEFDEAEKIIDEQCDTLKSINRKADGLNNEFVSLLEKMAEFDILEYRSDEYSKEDLIKLIDEKHQEWYNKLDSMQDDVLEIESKSNA